MKIINLNTNSNYSIPKKTFQYLLNTYSYGLSKNIWKNYSIQTADSKHSKTNITFYKSNFSFPIIKINYSNKYDREFFEVSYNNKRKVFSNLSSLNIWLNNYFFSKPKILIASKILNEPKASTSAVYSGSSKETAT